MSRDIAYPDQSLNVDWSQWEMLAGPAVGQDHRGAGQARFRRQSSASDHVMAPQTSARRQAPSSWAVSAYDGFWRETEKLA